MTDDAGSDLDGHFRSLRAEVGAFRKELKAMFSGLRADMHKVDAEHKKWILTTVLAVIGSSVALAGFLTATLRPQQASQAAASPAPIIINVPPAAQLAPAASAQPVAPQPNPQR